VVVFEMLAGALPFDGPTPLSRVVAVTRDPPRDLRALAPEAPDALVAVVERCLEKDPSARFVDGAALVAAVQRVDGSTGPSGERAPIARVVTSVGTDVEARTEAAVVSSRTGPDAAPNDEVVDGDVEAFRPRRRGGAVALVALGVTALLGGAFVARPWESPRPARPTPSAAAPGSGAPSASPSVQPEPAAPSGRIPLSQICSTREIGPAVRYGCPNESVGWCDEKWAPIACCAKGLVPIGPDGACGCPPGGSLKMETVPGCPPGESNQMLSMDHVQEVINAQTPAFIACYERDLKDRPRLGGKLDVHVALAPDGRVVSARIASSSLPGSNVQSCVLDVVRTLKFDAPRGGLGFSFNHPLEFDAGG
jgi:TonB family protein